MASVHKKTDPLLEKTVTDYDSVLVSRSNETTASAGAPIRKDGSSYPSVFEEAEAAILASIMVYGVADLRTLVRKGKLKTENTNKGAECLLDLPLSAADIVLLVSENKSVIQHEIGLESTELYLDAFDDLLESSSEENEEEQQSASFELQYNTETGETSCFAAAASSLFDMVHIDDEFSDRECVCGISVHHGAAQQHKRITLAFRGCTTRKDWRISADAILATQENPVVASCKQEEDEEVADGTETEVQRQRESTKTSNPKWISIHRGFHNYLFQPTSSPLGDGTETNKFESIISILQALKKQYPDYGVYVTGHSLGAALATIFAFEAAASQRIVGVDNVPAVITCIPIASPMVGNLAFEQAFKTLERQGRIRCLRVSNHFDIFTQMPDRGTLLYAVFFYWGFHLILPLMMAATFLFFLCFQNTVFRHVGMDLHLYGSRRRRGFKIKHTRGSADRYCGRLFQDVTRYWKQTVQRIMTVPFVCFCCDFLCCKEDFNRNHSIQEHRKRLNDLSSELRVLYLNDLQYTEKTRTSDQPEETTEKGQRLFLC